MWVTDFFAFKSFDNNMVYSLGLSYIYSKGIVAQQKSYGFKSLVKLGVENINFKITISRTVFNFSCKTSVFQWLRAFLSKKTSII